MADGPIRRKTEKALRDIAGVPVTLFYDEDNDRTIMARADEDGALTIVGEVTAILTANDTLGDAVELSAETQNNKVELYVNSDDVLGSLQNIQSELQQMNLHLSSMTDMWLDNEDINKE